VVKARDCAHSVYEDLASLYVVMGDFQKALSALGTSRTKPLEKRYRPQFAMLRRTVLVDMLGALGKGPEAARIAAELYAQPRRTGMESSPAKVERLSRSFRYALALDGRMAVLAEQASYAPLPEGPLKMVSELSTVAATRWEVRRAVLQLTFDDDRLALLARPNISESEDWSAWRLGDLADIVGLGVMKAAFAQARRTDAAFPESVAYYDALDGEVAFRGGDLETAVDLAAAALAKLPREEALLRWRTLAWQADALRRLGKAKEARLAYGEVLQRWPSIFRILGLKLPATLAVGAHPLAQETGLRMARSARFSFSPAAPYTVGVESDGKVVELCLRDDSGSQIACATGDKATAALDAFHNAAFTPKLSLTESDLRSLDGSPVRVGADEALKKVLGP
jgi:tetratricopeptide (TPR) repeat protein